MSYMGPDPGDMKRLHPTVLFAEDCEYCDGTGSVHDDSLPDDPVTVACAECNGTGQTPQPEGANGAVQLG